MALVESTLKQDPAFADSDVMGGYNKVLLWNGSFQDPKVEEALRSFEEAHTVYVVRELTNYSRQERLDRLRRATCVLGALGITVLDNSVTGDLRNQFWSHSRGKSIMIKANVPTDEFVFDVSKPSCTVSCQSWNAAEDALKSMFEEDKYNIKLCLYDVEVSLGCFSLKQDEGTGKDILLSTGSSLW